MTDYLAEIAAWTVECSVCYKSRGKILNVYFISIDCDTCKGSGRVLDPRFEGLRTPVPKYNIPSRPPPKPGDPGYTVNRDLAVLLVCLDRVDGASRHDTALGAALPAIENAIHFREDVLEAAAKAVYEWLEAESKVKS